MTQIEFLDQLGRELDGAAGRLVRDQRRSRFRALLAPAAGLAVAAAIAVAVWPGAPADPEREVAAPTEAASPTEILGILRRPETEADRAAADDGARRALRNMFDGEPRFRLLSKSTPGGMVLAAGLVTPAYGRTGPGEAQAAKEGVCTYIPMARGGSGTCWTVGDILGAEAFETTAEGRLQGLAPDGAVEVRVSTDGGERSAPVQDNFFQVDVAGLERVTAIVLLDDGGEPIARNSLRADEGG